MTNLHKPVHLDALGHTRLAKTSLPGRAKLAGALLTTASAAVLSILMANPADAQAVPAECTPSPALTGGTIVCTAAAPAEIDGIVTTVDDLTIVVGDAATPTSVNETAGDGINMSGSGTLAINIVNAGSTVTGSRDGIRAVRSAVPPGDLTIVSAGTVIGGDRGVVASSSGAGAISVTANIVTGGISGIDSDAGSGDTMISLTSTAMVTGQTGAGIDARSTGGGITLQGSSGDVVGATDGFYSRSMGGDILVDNFDSVTGNEGDGIYVASAGGGITVTAVDTILGTGGNGILADSDGGDISIQGSGTVGGITGTGGSGIFADGRGGAGGDINIGDTATLGAVTGSTNGIYARTDGAGAISVTTADVTGTTGDGIYARSNNSGVVLDSSAGAVVGGNRGIYGGQSGGGVLNINANDVTGSSYGILTRQSGAGAQTIVANNVTATANAAIFANGRGSSLDITVTGTAMGLNTGIDARNVGSGALTINAANATGTNFGGIFARNGSYIHAGTDLSITSTGTISGATGIYAVNYGTGILSITTADVTGTWGDGIYANNSGADLSIDSSAGAVSGTSYGISATNNGTGSLGIKSSAVAGSGNAGIRAYNGANGTNLNIEVTGTTEGRTYGIRALSAASGATMVKAQNIATTSGSYGRGIYARTAGTSLSITSTGDINSRVGISARHSGSGDTIISANNIESSQAAIDVRNQSFGVSASNDLIVQTTGIVSGAISAVNSNAGSVSVSTNSVTAINGNAITALGFGTFVDVKAMGDVAGDFIGISASNRGSGAVTVLVTNVSALTGTAIDANNSSGTGIKITTTGGLSGLRSGIEARNRGTGEVNIQVNEASGQNGYGILALNGAASTPSPPGTNLIIEASGSVSGAVAGIFGRNYGTGILSIEAVDVTASNGFGIYADQFANPGRETGNLEVTTAGLVTGSTDGIKSTNRGTGTLSITTADVTGTAGNGIDASDRATSAGISIDSSAGAVMGGLNGINVSHAGTDGVVINASNVTGGITGIFADAGTGDLLLNIGGDVTGGANGILTITQGGTNLTVTAAQTISGGTTGIATMAQSGSTTSNDNLNILGTVNGAIMSFEGDDIVTLADGGAVNGAIMLGTGADTLNLNAVTTGMLRGGDDDDILNFSGGAGLINNSGDAADAIAEFETYNFNVGGFILGGAHNGLTNVNFNAGETMLLGTLTSIQSNIATGAILQIADGAMLVSNVANAGSLSINMGDVGTFAIDGNFTQSAIGDLTLDIQDATNSDLITVTGDVALGGTLNLIQSGLFSETITLIDGSAGVVGSFDTVSGLQNGLLGTQSIVTDLATSNVNLVTGPADVNLISSLTPNQAATANALTTQFSAGSLTGGLLNLTLGLGITPDAATLSALLDELTPEIVNAGIDGVRLTQNRFRKTLMSQYQADDSGTSGEVAALGTFALAAATGAKSQVRGPQIWGTVNYNYHRNDATVNNKGYRADGFELTAGVSGVTLGAWQVGFAAGYSDFDTNDLRGTRDRSASELFRFGVHGSAAFGTGALGLNGHVDIALDYGYGNNDITMFTDGALPALGTAQNGTADTETYGMSFRLNLDGSGDTQWPIRPFVSVAYDHFSQDALALTGGGVTDLVIDNVDLDRIAFGYGIRGDHIWGQTTLRVGLAGYHYEGDTQTAVTSRFLATGVNGVAFTTVGFDIRDQFQLDAGISQNLGDGWSLSVDGYAEFGDIESYGGLFRIAKKF